METLRFLHLYFQFSLAVKLRLWPAGLPSWEECERIYREDQLPRRTLGLQGPSSFRAARTLFSSIQREESDLGIKIIVSDSTDCPPALRDHIPPEKLPALLYLRGQKIPDELNCVAVVGTRRPSPLGVDAAANFSAYFSQMNLHVISGLARGIDTLVHRENLSRGTVAVLGSGLGKVYPRENHALAEEILRQGGTLLSPFPLYQVPLPQNFPARNELIAALACGTVVVEGAEQSGAAITGMLALSMSKTVVVLPQDFRSDFGRGAVRLQQAGGVFVTNEEEALQAIYSQHGGFAHEGQKSMRRRTFSFGEFQMICGKSVAEAIVLLEEGILRGRIERIGPQRYRFAHPSSRN